MDITELEIPQETIDKWQATVDILAEVANVPAALIMKVDAPNIEVFKSSNSEDNPYKEGDREQLTGLYCEWVIEGKQKLLVPNALEDPAWDKNPDIKLGMVSYLGFPILCPGDEPFGTICVLDSKTNEFNDAIEGIMMRFRDLVESQLALEYNREEMRRAHIELRESEIKHRTLFQNAQVGMFRTRTSDGKIIECNETGAKILGYSSPNEVMAEYIAAEHYVDPNVRKQMMELLTKEGRFSAFQAQVTQRDGSPIWVEFSATLYQDEGYLESVVIDITKRKEAEDALRESEELHRGILESINEAIYVTDSEHRVTYVSPYCKELVGYDPEELYGWSYEEYKAKFYTDNPINNLQDDIRERVFEGEKFRPYVIEHRHKNGSRVLLEENESPRYDAEGNIIGTIGAARDITERKKAEDALSEKEAILRATLESTDDGILVVDNDQNVLLANSRFAELWQIPEELLETANDKVLVDYVQEQLENPNEFRERVQTFYKSSSVALDTLQFIDGRVFERYTSPLIQEGTITGRAWSFRDVTVSKRGELALIESESKYRALAEKSLQGIAIMHEGRIVYANQAYAEVSGDTVEELIAESPEGIWKRIHPEDLEWLVTAYAGYLEGDQTAPRVEYRVIHKDGSTRWVESYATPIEYNGGHALQVAQIDITERKNAVMALQDSEGRLAKAQLIAHIGNWDWNITEEKLFWSDEIYRIFGLSPRKFEETYEAFLSFVHPDDRELVQQSVNNALENDISYSIDHRIVLKDGSMKFVHEQASVYRDEAGRPVRMIGTVQDITERKTAEEALKESEARLRAIFEQSPIGIEFFDNDGFLVDMNKAAKDQFGIRDLEDVIGIFNIFKDPNAPDWVNKMFRSGEVVRYEDLFSFDRVNEEKQYQTEKKGFFHADFTHYPLRAADGSSIGSVMHILDITERKMAEQRIVETRDSAEFFVDLMSHDISNIHQAVSGTMELLLYDENVLPSTREIVTESVRQVSRATHLINDVKKFRSIETNPSELVAKDLREVLSVAKELVQENMPEKQLVIHTDLDSPNLNAFADEMLNDVFYSILHNAMKHDPKDVVEVDVVVRSMAEDSYLKISLIDHGMGISDKLKENLFQRIAKKKEGYWGTGIGLTLTKRIIDHYGGEIWVEDRVPGDHTKGASITMTLPIAK